MPRRARGPGSTYISYRDVLQRIKNVSLTLPLLFKVDWTPPEAESEIASRLITSLEGRRVLYNPYEAEMPRACVSSVEDIVKNLAEELKGLDRTTDLFKILSSMRASSLHFLTNVQLMMGSRFADYNSLGFGQSMEFNDHLGRLRARVGRNVAELSVMYGIDVDSSLASILPPEP